MKRAMTSRERREQFAKRLLAMPAVDPEDRKEPDERVAYVLAVVKRLMVLEDRTIVRGLLQELDFEQWDADSILAAFRVLLELGWSEDRDGMAAGAGGAIRTVCRERTQDPNKYPVKVRDNDVERAA